MSEESQRWASLDLLYDHDCWHDRLALPTPMLESLVINGQGMQLPSLPTQHAQGFSIVLYHANGFSWTTAPLTGLRALELEVVFPNPRVEQLLDIVAANPFLERLSIGDMRIPLNPNAKLRKVEAPNLRYLGCSTPAKSESLIDLINHLVVQSNCCLNVRIIDILHNLPEIISKLFGYIRDRINRLDQTFSVGLHLDSAWAGGLALKCPPTNPVIFARFSWEFPELGIEPELRHIADELEPAFRDTRELRFSSERSSDAELSLPKLANVFTQRLPRLSRLAVPSVPWVLAYLTDPEPEHGCISPNLQHLRQLGGEWQPRLLELLESRRREPGVKTIETIVLENVRVDPSNLEALKELVGEVVVETTR